MNLPDDILIGSEIASEYIGISRKQMRNLTNRPGEISAYKCGKSLVYDADELKEYKAKYYADGLTVRELADFNALRPLVISRRLRKYRVKHIGIDRRKANHRPPQVYDRSTLLKLSTVMGIKIPPENHSGES